MQQKSAVLILKVQFFFVPGLTLTSFEKQAG